MIPGTDLTAAMTRWRHAFHRRPELGFAETATAGCIAGLLRDFGIETHAQVGGTGVVGVLRRGTGPVIALRADMDALAITEETGLPHASEHPGRMHACGHDGHMAMLLGAAAGLARGGRFAGTAVFVFQPAEEHGRGAQAMLDDGLLERFGIEEIYGMHVMPRIPEGRIVTRPGQIMASEDLFEIRIEGRGGHASTPHLALNPITVGAEMVQALQSIIASGLDPLESGVVSITDFAVAATRNAIPARVTLRGDVRAFSDTTRALVERRARAIAQGIGAAHGAGIGFDWSQEFAPTVNSAPEAALAARVATELTGAPADCAPLMGAEDFGRFLQHRPGAFVFLGACPEGAETGDAAPPPLHSPLFDFNDRVLGRGAAFWMRLIERRAPA